MSPNEYIVENAGLEWLGERTCRSGTRRIYDIACASGGNPGRSETRDEAKAAGRRPPVSAPSTQPRTAFSPRQDAVRLPAHPRRLPAAASAVWAGGTGCSGMSAVQVVIAEDEGGC